MVKLKSLFLYSITVTQLLRYFYKKVQTELPKLLVILWFLLVFNNAFAQHKASFTWSDFEKVDKYSQTVFTYNDDKTYGLLLKYSPTFHNKLSKFEVKIYDKTLKIYCKKHFVINKYKERVLEIWYAKNRIYFITQIDLANQKVGVRLRIIDCDNSNKEIVSEDIIVLVKNHFNRNLDFHLVKKDSSVAIWHTNILESAEKKQSISYLSYSLEMKLLDKAIIDLPEKAELCKVIRVDDVDSGKFLIYTKEYAVRPLEKRGFAPNYKFVFYLANPSKESSIFIAFKSDVVYLDRARLKYKNEILEATGLFSDKLDGKQPGPKLGIWYFRYDFNKHITAIDSIQYFDKTIKSLATNKFQSSLMRNSKFEAFYVDYFIKLNSKERILVAEQFFLLPASIGSSYTYNRFYGDILLLFLNEKGEIRKGKRLLKAQQTYNNFGEFSSYYLERKDTMLRFFYNDNSVNGEDNFKHLVWHKQSCLTLNEVSANSENKYNLANYSEIKGIIQVRDMLEISPNQYLVYAYHKKKGKLGIMKLE